MISCRETDWYVVWAPEDCSDKIKSYVYQNRMNSRLLITSKFKDTHI